MNPIIDHLAEGSLFLWLDSVLINEGRGFVNYTGDFTKVAAKTDGGFISYASQFRQFVYDASVSGAIVPSGVYINGSFQNTGISRQIDFTQGQYLSTANTANPSGAFSYKEVNLYFTNESEEVVLFEKKYQPNARHLPQFTGANPTDQTYPLIFIKQSAGNNKLMCFDGINDTTMPIRLIVIADTPYLYKSICGRIRDKKNSWIPIFQPSEMPFNAYGSLKFPFSYSAARASIQSDPTRLALITDVRVSDVPSRVTTELLNFRIFAGIIDLDLSIYRVPT